MHVLSSHHVFFFNLKNKIYLEMDKRRKEWSSMHQKELICSTNKVKKNYVVQNSFSPSSTPVWLKS